MIPALVFKYNLSQIRLHQEFTKGPKIQKRSKNARHQTCDIK